MKKYLSGSAKFALIPTAVFLGFIITVCITAITSFAEEYNNITDNVLRLHILANSDSEADQALKLRVRDAVLAASGDFSESGDNAVLSAAANLDVIQRAAEAEIKASGYDYPVSVELTDMYFDPRIYTVNGKDYTMPEGVYTAVRVTIGEAEGKNWWCVMYPPLCLPAVTAETVDVISESFTDDQIDIMEQPQKYEAKLYVVELWNRIANQ
ncbi:MAG: stage II sporulation protein R [Ruminococcus sp.]|jgi:stage II sporulation protein R|nr:stage II sporulation protein R [Ruminococcus sp.]